MPGTLGSYVLIDPVKLAELMRSPTGPVVRALIEDGELVKVEAQRLVGVSQPDPVPRRQPHRPGTLRDSIVKRLAQDGEGVLVLVGSDVPYALYHHEGTPAHPIEATERSGARNAAGEPLLVFYWPRTGRVMFVRRVQHPGTKPNRFLVNALRVLAGRYR